MIVLYGIANCDSVKKARIWLNERQIDYVFSDFKKTPPNEALIMMWLKQIPLAVLLNKRGTTWRRLSMEEQVQAETEQGAVELMVVNPSMIKRPVLVYENKVYCGFSPEHYHNIFGK